MKIMLAARLSICTQTQHAGAASASTASSQSAHRVCLGATAAQSLLGPQFKLMAQRGQPITSPFAPAVVATIHPSSILRAPDDESRKAALAGLVSDLRVAAARVR